jgi:signal transduction histidine kinase
VPSWSSRSRSTVLRQLRLVPTALGTTIVLALCLAAWLPMAFGSLDPVAGSHVFYVPILLAGARFGARAAIATALVATALIEPLGSGTPLGTWVALGALFVLVGWSVGSLSSAYADEVARERELVDREQALARERGELVQLVSHELRTPLTVIRGSVDTLLVRHPDRGDQRDLLEATARATVRLEEMLDVVLAAADRFEPRPLHPGQLELGPQQQLELGPQGQQLELGEIGLVELDPLIRHAAASIHGALNDRLDLDVPRGTRLATIEPYLWMMLRCLLDNAAKFSEPQDRITVVYERAGETVVISLSDEGPGLPSGYHRIAFEPFTQADASTRRVHPGMGMGLYTARRLARRLGGELEIGSRPGGGVTARVVLPATGAREVWGAGTRRPEPPDRAVGTARRLASSSPADRLPGAPR